MVDSLGDAYVTGWTPSTDFPVVNGYQTSGNATNGVTFITEFDPTGSTLLYSTYLGGTGGDYGNGIALDPSGNVYVTGYTYSTDFPVVNAYQLSNSNPTGGNAFVARINTTQTGAASLVYSTYLGGPPNPSSQYGDGGLGVAADGNGFAYVTGQTTSASFPTTASAYLSTLGSPNGSAFLSVLNTSGVSSLVYSTYLGGDDAGPFGDYGMGVAVDTQDDAYVVGQTTSDASGPFPTTPNAYQTSLNSPNGNAFVTEISAIQYGSQSLIYSTYLGGSTTSEVGDSASAITLDSAGKLYVTGDAMSSDFPVTTGAFQTTNSAAGKAFVSKLDLTQTGAQALVYSTFLGGTDGSEGEVGNAIAVDMNGDAFAAGSTSSTDFPTTSGAFQTALSNSSWNAYLTEMNTTGTNPIYSTYLGGSCTNPGDLGLGVAIDPLGNAYLAGSTCSSDFPVTTGALQTTLQGSDSGFVTKIPLPTSVISITVNPQTATLVMGGTEQFSASATLSDGTVEDVSGEATWTSSDATIVTVTNLFQSGGGYPLAVGVGTATITATIDNVSGSSGTITVIAAPPPPVSPVITSVSPTSGAAGTQVTISGSGFGSSQGSGAAWLGTTPASIVSWSDTQVVADVAAASTSGVAQIQQNGILSNSVTFTIGSPTVTSVTPTSGTAGTSVTIAGSGFGATQGNGQVQLGTMTGVVTSWSDTQVVATVATGAASGSAQILQNGVWSNTLPFSINGPQITGVSPSSGSAGTAVTVTGSGFGAAQGNGIVWIGSTNGVVVSWSDSQVVANVASGALSGVVYIQQNGVSSNSYAFTVPPTDGSNPLTMMPNTFSMVVGDTRSINATNTQGQSLTGLTWTSSNTNIVSLSTDDPPILTAVAAGNATITAGNASAEVTVYPDTLLNGTVQWTNPSDGSGIYSIVPAVPSASDVDLFAFESSGNIAAIKNDGTLAWTANSVSSAIPDFQGGLVVTSGTSVYDINGATGQPNPAYTSTNDNYIGPVAVGVDGTIFAVDGDALVGINPASGASKFRIQMQDSTSSCSAPL
ncbi:MAG: SBBP repeat-containing protein [Candidatus Acidiferrales bacterium]